MYITQMYFTKRIHFNILYYTKRYRKKYSKENGFLSVKKD